MAGISTELLAGLIQQTYDRLGERIRESNQHLADQIEASNDRLVETNQRLTEAIRDLAHKVEKGQEGFMEFKTNVAGKLSAVESSLAWAKTIGIVVVIRAIFGLVTYTYAATDRAARIEQSIIALRESVVALKDHAQEQDRRIGKLIEMREPRDKSMDPVVPPTPDAVRPNPAKSSAAPHNATSPQAGKARVEKDADGFACCGLIPLLLDGDVKFVEQANKVSEVRVIEEAWVSHDRHHRRAEARPPHGPGRMILENIIVSGIDQSRQL